MQWLIDLVIDAIGIPPTFIDRGDPGVEDWVIGDLTVDTAWHKLDLTAIVPLGASAVIFNVIAFCTIAGKHAALRTHGNVGTPNESFFNNQVANIVQGHDMLVHPNSDGEIDYWVDAGGWILFSMTVKGWWL